MTSEEIFQRAQDAVRNALRRNLNPPQWALGDMGKHQTRKTCEHCGVEIYGLEVNIVDGHWLCEECL